MKPSVELDQKLCVGCGICALECSYALCDGYNIRGSLISINWNARGSVKKVKLLNGCFNGGKNPCGFSDFNAPCVKGCFTKALLPLSPTAPDK